MNHSNLTFLQLREANIKRQADFKNNKDFNLAAGNDCSNWSIAEWTNALAGEVGEACNIAKKIRRGDFDGNLQFGNRLLMEELADVVIYADLCAKHVNRDLGQEIVDKFNHTSQKIGSSVRLEPGKENS